MAQLRHSSFPPNFLPPHPASRQLLPPTLPKFLLLHNTSPIISQSAAPIQFFYPTSPNFHHHIPFASGGDAGGGSRGGGGGGGGGRGGSDDDNDSDYSSSSGGGGDDGGFGPIGAFLRGWRSRVAADPQFPFKVLMEELVGVTACVIGDMASRPNFGLNELDFVFSTLVVGSILNFVLMYLLAPTAGPAGGAAAAAAVQSSLPSIFASCPPSHMFEPGSYGLLSRLGTFVYKGTLFAAVGFAAGLVGTALSNGLITMRKKMDPNFETPNKPPPTVLNASTWALHMGISSNLRYQTLNGIEFLLAKGLPPFAFKSSVVVLRCLNNVLGGMSFVVLARLTGSQAQAEGQETPQSAGVTDQPKEGALAADDKQNLVNHAEPESAASK